MKSASRIIISIAIFAVLVLAFYFLGDKMLVEKQAVVTKPLVNEAEYTEAFNEAINRAADDQNKYLKYAETPEGKETVESYWNKMQAIVKGRSRDIKFFGRVVDQYGHPVAGATVEFVAISGYLTEGSGHQNVTTDDRGIFQIDEVDGTGLSIDKISKEGYEIRVQQKNFDNYPRFEDSVLWENYTDGNPYIFKAWKVIERGYPEISSAKSTYGFKLNQVYSMDFTSSDKRKVKKDGELNLDMRVVFNRNESGDWELNLSVPAGGLIETSDQYMNLAPVNGYQPSLVYNGTERDHMIPKKFYILSRGKLYGRLKVEIRPVMKIGAGLGIEHVMNLEGGRNLEVK